MRRFVVLAALVALTGCGAPSATYVSNKDVGAYFTVPTSWFAVSAQALDKAEFDQISSVEAQERYDAVRWQEAYSLVRMKASDVLTTDAQDFPVAYVRVRNLTASERNSISLNALRDLVFPVTTLAGEASDQAQINLLNDREVTQPGGDGVDTKFDIKIDQKVQRVRQVAVMSTDRRTIYLFVIRCSTTCFKANSNEINLIADSFTVRGNRG